MRRPDLRRSDIALGIVVAVIGVVEQLLDGIQPAAVSVPLAAVAGLSLAFRRRWPLVVVLTCFGALVLDTFAGVPLDQPVTPIAWIFISMFSMASVAPLRRAVLGLTLGLLLFSITLAKTVDDLWFGLVIITGPWLLGLVLHGRERQVREHASRAEELEARRASEVAAAAAIERTRIARDLHDVIAHSVSVMVVQASAAGEVLATDPEAAAAAIAAVQDTGRQALTEMGALLGMLRAHSDEIGLMPQPGLAELDALLSQTRASGLPVELVMRGKPSPLPAGVELSLYRVVQESLTNTRKHSTNATAVVTLEFAASDIRVEIVDDGQAASASLGGGHGTVGMRERVALYGGRLEAGPRPGAGYRVCAHIPIGPSS